jgi:hypothetical protein
LPDGRKTVPEADELNNLEFRLIYVSKSVHAQVVTKPSESTAFMAAAAPVTSPRPFDHLRTSPMTVEDKYRGAVVEVRISMSVSRPGIADQPAILKMVLQDLQLSPAFALPQDEAISRAIELAYDRDFSHIPYIYSGTSQSSLTTDSYASVLDRNRKPVGYVDVVRLKEKWEGGNANPVRLYFVFMILR